MVVGALVGRVAITVRRLVTPAVSVVACVPPKAHTSSSTGDMDCCCIVAILGASVAVSVAVVDGIIVATLAAVVVGFAAIVVKNSHKNSGFEKKVARFMVA